MPVVFEAEVDLAFGLFFSSSLWMLVSPEPTLSTHSLQPAEDIIQKSCRCLVHGKEDGLSQADSLRVRRTVQTGRLHGRDARRKGQLLT